MALKISIVTPEKNVLAMECDEAIVPGVNGELGLLSQHVPLISALQPGVLTTIKDGKRSYFVVSFGFAEIDEDRVTILTGTCERAEDVDVARAKTALDDARKQLANLAPDDQGFEKQLMRARRAEARLEGAARVR